MHLKPSKVLFIEQLSVFVGAMLSFHRICVNLSNQMKENGKTFQRKYFGKKIELGPKRPILGQLTQFFFLVLYTFNIFGEIIFPAPNGQKLKEGQNPPPPKISWLRHCPKSG